MAEESALNLLERIGLQVLEQALGYGLGGAMTPAIAPFTQDLTNKFWQLHPSIPLSPADAASAVVQGALDTDAATNYAAMGGLSGDVFQILVKINGAPIAPDQALDLWNRGEITEDDVNRALLQSRLKPEWVDTFKLLRKQILQIADLAEMVVQNILTTDDATARAGMLGVDPDDFAHLVLLAGNPPGPETVLEMWNRGIIGEDDATTALLQSRLKPQWVEPFKETRLRPATAAQAVEATIKQRLTPDEGAAIAAAAGVSRDAFDLAVDAGGRPIATGEALTLYKRGEFTKDQVIEAIARSDVRTEYADDILKLAVVYPSLYQVKQILATGAVTDDVAKSILQKEGYTDDVIAGVIAAAHGVKLASQKQLTLSAITDSYTAKEIDKAQASTMIGQLGYDDNDTALIIGYADYQNAKTFRNAVLAVVKARYLASDIDEQTASNTLDQVGIPPDARDQYLQLWTFDLQANPHLLTLAQCNDAVKQGIFTAQQYHDYLPRLGYVEPEISVLMSLYAGGPLPGEA